MKEAIILAGGFGTRLQQIVSDIPKPMILINGIPFLQYLLNQINGQHIEKVVLAVGYKADHIMTYFSNSYCDMQIIYSIEETPLFTGGAIKKAMHYIQDENVFVLNGDTFFDVNLRNMENFHKEKNADLTIAVKRKEDCERYGTIVADKTGKINAFREKSDISSGLISGGVYCFKSKALSDIKEDKFSIEKDFFERYFYQKNFYIFESDGYFIDIGIPEDYYKAQKELNRK